jgi:hypothetical protein
MTALIHEKANEVKFLSVDLRFGEWINSFEVLPVFTNAKTVASSISTPRTIHNYPFLSWICATSKAEVLKLHLEDIYTLQTNLGGDADLARLKGLELDLKQPTVFPLAFQKHAENIESSGFPVQIG